LTSLDLPTKFEKSEIPSVRPTGGSYFPRSVLPATLGTRVPHSRFSHTMVDDKEGQYRKRAEECLRVAGQTTHEDLRKQYTRLAECYLELAEAEAALCGKEPPKCSPGSD